MLAALRIPMANDTAANDTLSTMALASARVMRFATV
jgi:hypothetical protein